MKEWLKKEYIETKLLLKNIPAIVMTLFVVSIVAMNLLASKLIVDASWIALDAGITVSWLAFLTMDMVVKRFGPKASIKLSIIASLINVIVMYVFTLAALIPGDWALNDYASGMNWWIILASTVAFIVSGIVNSITNWMIQKSFKNRHEFKAYAISSYASTMLGQFVDNLVFALVFTVPAFGIGLLPTLMFALTGAVVELICQIVFSPIGYKVANNWKDQGIGDEYLKYIEEIEFNESIDNRDE